MKVLLLVIIIQVWLRWKIAIREAWKKLNEDIKIITAENVLKNSNSLKTLGCIKKSSENSTYDIPDKHANHTKQTCSIQ